MGNKTNLVLLTAAIALVAGLFWKRQTEQSRPHPIAIPSAAASSAVDPLIKDQRADVLYKLSPADQKKLLGAVEQFCVKTYDRNSCLHHLITCGVPCLVAVPRPQRKKIFNEYQALRAERGLLPLPPHESDE